MNCALRLFVGPFVWSLVVIKYFKLCYYLCKNQFNVAETYYYYHILFFCNKSNPFNIYVNRHGYKPGFSNAKS
ncbi:hypothetical protein BpHYR1_034874 [Brachionus plicatilis]|uniref:Uncharacterized protein n=1 Tax=Brachionus plicatilis TaxID=10195 RepID=A0A3M7SHG7_BRAPC|nr:hypothetical protein BpHYR1_034874 [Brachionus plicatilis]